MYFGIVWRFLGELGVRIGGFRRGVAVLNRRGQIQGERSGLVESFDVLWSLQAVLNEQKDMHFLDVAKLTTRHAFSRKDNYKDNYKTHFPEEKDNYKTHFPEE